MSKKANHVMIGTFVLAAIAIAFVGILILGSGKFFKDAESYVLYFDGNLSGLDKGAPVDFKGVKVGQVMSVTLVYDHATDSMSVPVTVELDKKCFTEKNCDRNSKGVGNAMVLHIERGLRAKLKSQSFVTGKLKIELDYDENSPEVYKADENSELPEIPTMVGSLDSLAKRLKDMPFEDLVEDLATTAEAMSAMASSDELKSLLTSLDTTLQESQKLMTKVNKESQPFNKELLILMEELADAARSTHYLMDYIERHPEAFIYGKGKE